MCTKKLAILLITGTVFFAYWALKNAANRTSFFSLYDKLATSFPLRAHRCHNDNRTLNNWDYFLKNVLHTEALYQNVDTTGYVPDLQNWTNMAEAFQEFLKRYLSKTNQKSSIEPIRIIEVGSWKGGSALTMASICRSQAFPRKCTILAIDTWLGAPIVYTDKNAIIHTEFTKGNGRPKLFEKFLKNVVLHNASDIIKPFRLSSLGAAHVLQCFEMKADIIYIDGDHEYEGVKADLIAYYPLVKAGGLLFGDDAPNPNVIRAVRELVDSLNGKLQIADWQKEQWTWIAWNSFS